MRKVRSLRGVVTGNGKHVITQNDLRGTGWIVKEFHIWPNNMEANAHVAAKLWIGEEGDGGSLTFSDAGDNRCIAWGMAGGGKSPGELEPSTKWEVVDPHHVFTSTLSIITMTVESVAYLVTLEQVDLDENQEIMALIKERSQDDLSPQ